MKTKVLVCGAGGFIGTHLVTKLKQLGHYVIGADLKYPEFGVSDADEFHPIDLREQQSVSDLITSDISIIYQLAADMGGAGYIFTGDHDANIMHNSATINLNVLNEAVKKGVTRLLYTSSACIYPGYNQVDALSPNLAESSAYPANPDSEYGWEKLFSERLYQAYARNYGLDCKIVRLHNVFGPLGSWNNGKEKAPAAICRKVAKSIDGTVEVWGPGQQTRSFLYIEECIEGLMRITNSTCNFPVNLGSDHMISINDLVVLVADIADKSISISNVPGPMGVMGRVSDNKLIKETIGWAPTSELRNGLVKTYNWIYNQIQSSHYTKSNVS